MDKKIKTGLLIGLMIIMLLPLAQKNLPFLRSADLYGYYDAAPGADFSLHEWWSGNYGEEMNKYFNDHVGYRPDLVRVQRQIEYSLFDKLHFYPDMVGPDKILWDCSYADAYLGTDYVGYEAMQKTLVRLKRIQDTLAKKNVAFVMIDAPCKGYFYPDKFPPHLANVPKQMSNLDACIHICDSLGIHQVDFNGWFVSLKDKTPHLLYPRLGTHWSVYGAALAADSIVRYMEQLMHIRMPHPVIDKVTTQQKPEYTDDDLCKPLNLIFPFSTETYSYPHISYTTEAGTKKPNVVYIGDSFFCQWMYLCIPDNINDDWEYWNYFKGVTNRTYTYGRTDGPRVKDINWVEKIERTDCVVLIYTARGLPNFGKEFVDHAYEHYFPNDK